MRARVEHLLLILVALVGSSTVFFRYIEGWSWLDAYFFTMVTLSTVGYGTLVPETTIGKLATTALVVFGIAIFAALINELSNRTVRSRLRDLERRRRARLDKDDES